MEKSITKFTIKNLLNNQIFDVDVTELNLIEKINYFNLVLNGTIITVDDNGVNTALLAIFTRQLSARG